MVGKNVVQNPSHLGERYGSKLFGVGDVRAFLSQTVVAVDMLTAQRFTRYHVFGTVNATDDARVSC